MSEAGNSLVLIGMVLSIVLSGCSMNQSGEASDQVIRGGVPFQVLLEGNAAPFDVTRQSEIGPMMIGEQGPPPEFDLPIPIAESQVPSQLSFLSPTGFNELPELSYIDPASTVYAGRVPGTEVDAYVFSFPSNNFEGPADSIAVYIYSGDLFIDLSFVADDLAPGYSRNSRFRRGIGVADIFWWGPLDPNVSVAEIAIDGEPHAATRVRARYAVFDMSGTPQWAYTELTAFDSAGEVMQTVQIEALPPPDEPDSP